jgi:hypothetical protein
MKGCGGLSDVYVHPPFGGYAHIRNNEGDRTNVQLCFMLTAPKINKNVEKNIKHSPVSHTLYPLPIEPSTPPS